MTKFSIGLIIIAIILLAVYYTPSMRQSNKKKCALRVIIVPKTRVALPTRNAPLQKNCIPDYMNTRCGSTYFKRDAKRKLLGVRCRENQPDLRHNECATCTSHKNSLSDSRFD